MVISKENFLKNLQEIITVRDTPVSIPHEYPLFLLNKEIKKTIKVVLSGEGADEFLGVILEFKNHLMISIKEFLYKKI